MTKMWIGDNCHTYDRDNFEAQLECGIRKNYFILANATQTHFNLTYFPFVQGSEEEDESNYECLQKFISDSYLNVYIDEMAIRGLSILGMVFIAVNLA